MEIKNFHNLVEELDEMIVTIGRNIRDDLIKLKWAVGNRIVKEIGKRAKYGEEEVKGLAVDIAEDLTARGRRGFGASEIYRAIQFARQYPKLNLMQLHEVLGREPSWTRIKRDLLPEKSQANCGHEETIEVCRRCRIKI